MGETWRRKELDVSLEWTFLGTRLQDWLERWYCIIAIADQSIVQVVLSGAVLLEFFRLHCVRVEAVLVRAAGRNGSFLKAGLAQNRRLWALVYGSGRWGGPKWLMFKGRASAESLRVRSCHVT